MSIAEIILMVGSGLVLGIVLGFWLKNVWSNKKIESADDTATKIIEEAHRSADSIKKEATLSAKDTLYQMKHEFEIETKEKKNSLYSQEKRLLSKEENFDKKIEQLDKKESELSKKDRSLSLQIKNTEEKESKFNELIEKQKETLERISGISRENAKEELIKLIEDDARHEAMKSLRQIEVELKENEHKKSVEIMSTAIQRFAGENITERTVSIVTLPNEEMKGRIIGREGRNIRAI